MVLDLYKTKNFPEGKYVHYNFLHGITQMLRDAWTNALSKRTFLFFYLYKTSTYYSGGMPAVSVQNVTTYLAGHSSSYGRTHEFNYNNNLEASQRLNLPIISYDTNKFELNITKTISGTTISKINCWR